MLIIVSELNMIAGQTSNTISFALNSKGSKFILFREYLSTVLNRLLETYLFIFDTLLTSK
jgi:uncharacterized PurR-regulated membrane protein YhhQ (DUF165 family)